MLPSGLPDQVSDNEPLALFLTSSGHFSPEKAVVKPAPFMPNPKDGERSVCRHGTEPFAELIRLGTIYRPDATIYGAGVVLTSVVRGTGLTVEADEPPDRHANIRGWTWFAADPKMGKAANMEKALRIAEKTTLVRWDQ
jgi:hypothetical protein